LAASVRAVKGAAHRFAASPLTALLSRLICYNYLWRDLDFWFSPAAISGIEIKKALHQSGGLFFVRLSQIGINDL
jgi:hypothetical protein